MIFIVKRQKIIFTAKILHYFLVNTIYGILSLKNFLFYYTQILENKLVGNKIVLTENTLKLGKEKYKIKHKNKGNMSSIFGRGKDSKISYKIGM